MGLLLILLNMGYYTLNEKSCILEIENLESNNYKTI